jgi:hypothetical protein
MGCASESDNAEGLQVERSFDCGGPQNDAASAQDDTGRERIE